MASSFSHFYKRDTEERRQIVADWAGLSAAQRTELTARAEQGDAKDLIENYLTAFQLPEVLPLILKLTTTITWCRW